MAPYNQRLDSLQNHEENLCYRAGKMKAVRMEELPCNPRAIYMKSLWVGEMTKLLLVHKGRYTPLRGSMVKTWISS
jgi:hypothetical protein